MTNLQQRGCPAGLHACAQRREALPTVASLPPSSASTAARIREEERSAPASIKARLPLPAMPPHPKRRERGLAEVEEGERGKCPANVASR